MCQTVANYKNLCFVIMYLSKPWDFCLQQACKIFAAAFWPNRKILEAIFFLLKSKHFWKMWLLKITDYTCNMTSPESSSSKATVICQNWQLQAYHWTTGLGSDHATQSKKQDHYCNRQNLWRQNSVHWQNSVARGLDLMTCHCREVYVEFENCGSLCTV